MVEQEERVIANTSEVAVVGCSLLLALDRIQEAGMNAVLVAAIECGVNVDEVGAIVEFGLKHPAVIGVVLQPVTHEGRHIDFDPMEQVTISDVIHGIVDQYLDYITNRSLPKPPNAADVQKALEGLWSASAVAGTEKTASQFGCAFGPELDLPYSMNHLKDHIFQIAVKDFKDDS